MVQQSREPFLLPFLRCSAHTAQSLGHPFPALCRAGVGLCVVLLGPLPSLHHLRRGLPLFVRQLHRYYAAVRLLQRVRVRRLALRLRGPACLVRQTPEVSRFSCMLFLGVPGVFDYAGTRSARDLVACADVAFPLCEQGRHPVRQFSELNTRPTDASVYASPAASRRTAQDSRPGWIRFSFPVGLFHPLQHAGLSRRTRIPALPYPPLR